MTNDQFVLLGSIEAQQFTFWNLSLISSAEAVDGCLKIRMNNGDTVNVSGAGSTELLLLLLRHSVLPNGVMPEEFIETMEAAFKNTNSSERPLTMSAGG
mgnify:CR=1 FL=1